ncbi:MAG: CYTH and CHAD domain-containing protein [Alphaproteobacteria bacterium]|nr:CYTH and CHAD domain-containing protein [Alphaproteobacteria bacterium]
MDMGQETELKFIGPEEALARVRQKSLFRRFARGRKAKTRAMHAVYFDTETFALREAGYVLRVRNEDGGFVQTVKSVNGPDLATRVEIKVNVESLAPDLAAIPDKAVRRDLKAALGGGTLAPMFSVEMRRTTVLLTPKRGTSIEAAFDVGAIKTAGDKPSSLPVVEFELELLAGDANELVACARGLTADLPLMLFLQSKAERGYALAADAAEAPVTAEDIAVTDDATADVAFRYVVAHCLKHLLGNWAAVTVARDPEGIHQMRVALRRLRSALSLFGGPFRAALSKLEDEVRWVAGVMGAARDLDVFQEDVFRPAAEAHGEDDRLLELATVVRTRRRIAWVHVFEALESERFRRLVLELASATFAKPWLDATIGGDEAIEPARDFARRRMQRRYRRAVRLGRRITELDAAERHELRIKLKKLRYGLDFFRSLFAKQATQKFLKRLSDLQDTLGRLNDAAVANALVEEILNENGDGAAAAAIGYAGGLVAGWHLGHARLRVRQLERRWARLAKLGPPWR